MSAATKKSANSVRKGNPAVAVSAPAVKPKRNIALTSNGGLTTRGYFDLLSGLPDAVLDVACGGIEPVASIVVSYLVDFNAPYELYPGTTTRGIAQVRACVAVVTDAVLPGIAQLPLYPHGALINERAPKAAQFLASYYDELKNRFYPAVEATNAGFNRIHSEYARLERKIKESAEAATAATAAGGNDPKSKKPAVWYGWYKKESAIAARDHYFAAFKVAYDEFTVCRTKMGDFYRGSPSGPGNGLWGNSPSIEMLRTVPVDD